MSPSSARSLAVPIRTVPMWKCIVAVGWYSAVAMARLGVPPHTHWDVGGGLCKGTSGVNARLP